MNHNTLPLSEKILRLSRTLAAGDIPFAFGGAIARNYYAEPRLTLDMDVGIFLPPVAHRRVLPTLATLFPIPDTAHAAASIERDGQIRLDWDYTPVDLFFSYDPFHEMTAARTRRVPFAESEIPILSAEDVMVHKILFNRPKDWRDIADILSTQRGQLDLGYMRQWLTSILPSNELTGAPETRVALFDDLVDAVQRQGHPERE